KNKVPMRRCVGCMESKPKRELIRIVASPDGEVLLDLTGKANGRGAYLCPDPECAAKAGKKNAFARSLHINVSEEDLQRIVREIGAMIHTNDQRTNRE
ncbi:MAG TPA: YlxR family protein, partial [Bacillota bacterium]|nr:YlxR family protein [Bacillota bacterium]